MPQVVSMLLHFIHKQHCKAGADSTNAPALMWPFIISRNGKIQVRVGTSSSFFLLMGTRCAAVKELIYWALCEHIVLFHS
eukprot:scaffold121198_cov14-Tisochrysis_lutea.AAC.1